MIDLKFSNPHLKRCGLKLASGASLEVLLLALDPKISTNLMAELIHTCGKAFKLSYPC